MDKRSEELKQNFDFFQSNLYEYLHRYGQGKFLLIKGQKVIKCFDTKDDALKAGKLAYNDEVFSVQKISDEKVNLGIFSVALCQ